MLACAAIMGIDQVLVKRCEYCHDPSWFDAEDAAVTHHSTGGAFSVSNASWGILTIMVPAELLMRIVLAGKTRWSALTAPMTTLICTRICSLSEYAVHKAT